MTRPTNEVSRIVTKASAPLPTLREAMLGRSAAALLAVIIAGLGAAACSSDGSQRGANTDTQEKNFNPFMTADSDAQGANAEAANGGTVQLGQPFLSGTCTPNATASIIADGQRYVTVVFSNQQYGGDRNSPDYVKGRTEGRLIGDAKSTAPKCELHVPMKVTAGYRFSPTNVVVHGFAHRAFVYGAYRWANGGDGGYTFERQVPLNEPANSGGDDFVYTEQLHNMWSPTCSKTGGANVDTELVVTLQPYTATGTNDTIVAIDAFDVAGFGSLEQCGNPTSYDRVAQEGEDCGIVEMDYVHPVRCDTSKQTNICVYYPTNANTGTCVNASRRPAASELVVAYDGDCGGPFYKCCGNDEPLVCQFASGDARQNASSHYGRCVRPLGVGVECNKELYGACNGNSCNTTVDPCEAGATCTKGKCTAKKGNSFSTQSAAEPSDGEGAASNEAEPSSANESDDSDESANW